MENIDYIELAEYDSAALCVILSHKSDAFVRDVLSIMDRHGQSAALFLAINKPEAFCDILAGRSDEFVRDVLSIKFRYGNSVAHWLAEHNGAALRDILNGRDSLMKVFTN